MLERYHTACLSAKNLFQHSASTQNQQQNQPKSPRINIQLNINKSVLRAKNRLQHLGNTLDKSQKAISYEEQMRNMQLLELNKKEMIQIKAELFTVKKDYEKLDQEQQKQGIGFQKYKTLAKIEQDKAKKLMSTVSQVDGWLSELKNVVNFEDTNTHISEAKTMSSSNAGGSAEAEGFLNTSIRNLENILSNKDMSIQQQNSSSHQKQIIELHNRNQFFDIKQILKLNSDPTFKYQNLVR